MKEESRRDVRHVLVTLLSTAGNTGIGLILNLLMIKVMAPAQYGKFSSIMAVILISQEFLGRGVNDAIIRLGTNRVTGSQRHSSYIFLSGMLAKTGIFMLFSLAYIIIAPFILRMLGQQEMISATGAILVAVAGYGLWTFLLTIRQANLDFSRLAIEKPVCNIIRIIFLVLLIFFGMVHWNEMVWIYSLSFFIAAFVVGMPEFVRLFRLPFQYARISLTLKRILHISLWNTLASLAFVAFGRMDILVLTARHAATDVAVYNASWQILTVIDLCSISIMTAMIPKVCHHRSRRMLVQWIRRSISLSLVTALFCIVFSIAAAYIIPFFLNDVYIQSIPLMFIMLPSYLVTLTVFPLVGIIYAMNRFRMLAIINVSFVPVALAIYLLGSKCCGVTGIAWATAMLRTMMAAVLCFVIWKILPNFVETKQGA